MTEYKYRFSIRTTNRICIIFTILFVETIKILLWSILFGIIEYIIFKNILVLPLIYCGVIINLYDVCYKYFKKESYIMNIITLYWNNDEKCMLDVEKRW